MQVVRAENILLFMVIRISPPSQLLDIALAILSEQTPPRLLRPQVMALAEILAELGPFDRSLNSNLSNSREIQTANGVAIYPEMAARCLDDYVRTIVFARGLRDAINDRLSLVDSKPVRVLYAGCGPFATLALPVMATIPANEVQFDLLELNSDSFQCVQRALKSLGLLEHVASFKSVDASTFQIDPPCVPDVIIAEVMQCCLRREPQVAISRNLMMQAPTAAFIPQEVRVELKLVNPRCEFSMDGIDSSSRDRIDAGEVLRLNRDSVNHWKDCHTESLPGHTIRVPNFDQRTYDPMLFTTIRVYGNHVLQEYDSGLTHPSAMPNGPSLTPNSDFAFRYQLGQSPALTYSLADASANDGLE